MAHDAPAFMYLADEQIVLSGGMVVDSLGWEHQEPDDIDKDLHQHQGGADHELGLGRDATGASGGPLGCIEYPRDAVGLGQEGPIHNGEADTDAELLDGADNGGGLDHQQEGDSVAE